MHTLNGIQYRRKIWKHQPDGSVVVEFKSPVQEDGSSLSRQAKWQRERLSKSLCIQCGKSAPGRKMCPECRERSRMNSRNSYRLKAGIPLDAPIGKQGPPRVEP